MPLSTTARRDRLLSVRGRYCGASRARPAHRCSQCGGGHEITTQCLVFAGVLAGGQVVVGGIVGLAVTSAGDRDRVQPLSHGNHPPGYRRSGGLAAEITLTAVLLGVGRVYRLGDETVVGGFEQVTRCRRELNTRVDHGRLALIGVDASLMATNV